MIAAIQKQEDQTITLTITIPWADVKKSKDAIVADYTKSAQVSGFRKGKAPKKLVEGKLTKNVKEETLKKTFASILSSGY